VIPDAPDVHDPDHIVAAVLEGVCPECAGRLTPTETSCGGDCAVCGYRYHVTMGTDGLAQWSIASIPEPNLSWRWPGRMEIGWQMDADASATLREILG
jgi:uncharacterized protein (DUF983 family)